MSECDPGAAPMTSTVFHKGSRERMEVRAMQSIRREEKTREGIRTHVLCGVDSVGEFL